MAEKDYYSKTYEDVHKLPWQEKLNYYANNPTLYDTEMARVDNVLAGDPNYAAGLRWKNQLMTARNKAMDSYNKYDLTKPSNVTTIKPKYTQEIENLLSQITSAATNLGQNVDVTKDPRYKAQMNLMESNVEQGQRQTMEQMNQRGLLMSDMTTDRMAQIETAGMNQLNAIVPDLYNSIVSQNQNQISGLVTALQGYSGEAQRAFDNEFRVHQQGFNEALAKRDYNRAVDEWVFNKDLANREFNLRINQNALDGAINKLNTIGYVADEEMAGILGVPVGTQSSIAREAAANRANQWAMQTRALNAQHNEEKSTTINELLNIWQTSGEAPPGLENFGIKPGTPLQESAIDKLEEILALSQMQEIENQKEMEASLPEIQETYGVGLDTAEIIYEAWKSPTYDSALAELNNLENKAIMEELGIDRNKVIEALKDKYNYIPPENPSFLENLFGKLQTGAEARMDKGKDSGGGGRTPTLNPQTFYLPR